MRLAQRISTHSRCWHAIDAIRSNKVARLSHHGRAIGIRRRGVVFWLFTASTRASPRISKCCRSDFVLHLSASHPRLPGLRRSTNLSRAA